MLGQKLIFNSLKCQVVFILILKQELGVKSRKFNRQLSKAAILVSVFVDDGHGLIG